MDNNIHQHDCRKGHMYRLARDTVPNFQPVLYIQDQRPAVLVPNQLHIPTLKMTI
jgi:hypothetical protein